MSRLHFSKRQIANDGILLLERRQTLSKQDLTSLANDSSLGRPRMQGETSELHRGRGGGGAKKFYANKSAYGWNHATKPRNSGLTGVVLISISPRGIRFAHSPLSTLSGYPPRLLEARIARFAFYSGDSGSFRCLGFTLFLSFLPCATSHFINMKVSWRRWNSKTSQSEISSPVKTNDTNDIASCHGIYVIPFRPFLFPSLPLYPIFSVLQGGIFGEQVKREPSSL